MLLMRQYKQFGEKQFLFSVRDFLIKNKLGFIKEITADYIADGGNTWEKIFTVSTANKSVEIMIFSSIDVRTGYVREHGGDMVRLVLRWKTRNGYVYKSLAHHQRIDTLFNNIQKTVEKAQQSVFNLNYKEFTKGV
jgi:hypothetical protein